MRNEEGAIIKWFGTCTDIHDQKTASDLLEQKVIERTGELQKANLELEISNAELLQFASVASHDLKEPLRKIHIFSNLVKERYLNDLDNGAADYIERIIGSSSRMTRLINDLLTFSRLSVISLFELTDVNVILAEVLSDLELQVREKDAVIEITNFPKMELVPGQMRQVFQNIISNALKFSRAGVQPHISISCERVDSCSINAINKENGAFCRISIRDNGIGFDQQYSNKIFTIFQRLHSRDKYEGTGIGLAITKKIIEKHNGLIYTASIEGQGTTFTIILPVLQHRSENGHPAAEQVAKQPAT
jgi:two-component system CheB/CheR fusion protein